jgi:hypothetical protein
VGFSHNGRWRHASLWEIGEERSRRISFIFLIGGSGSQPPQVPRADGGTCITEAAVIEAGLPYRAIDRAGDCPACFSRPVASYLIKLNDNMPGEVRQEPLLPFVTRMAGTADVPAVEKARAEYLAIQTVSRVLSIVCREVLKREDLALFYKAVANVRDRRHAVLTVIRATTETSNESLSIADAGDYLGEGFLHTEACAGYAISYACEAFAFTVNERSVLGIAVDILDEAIKLGKQAWREDANVVVERLSSSPRHSAPGKSPEADDPIRRVIYDMGDGAGAFLLSGRTR